MMENYGEDETPSADMTEDKLLRPDAYQWTTYAERLQKAGISWRVYQEYDNFGDNLLSVFPAFRPCPVDSALYKRGRAWVSEGEAGSDRTRSDGEQLVAAFRKDLAERTLPQVSWIVTAADLSEHPKAVPARGEHVCARLIEALVDHPEMFARTAFIINYDEAGGFYDHVLPPVPAIAGDDGFSTVSVDGEVKDHGARDVPNPGRHPIGLGIRIPAMVISPWSRGGYVCSQLFDHTSVIRFIEARFGVREPNISSWRRSVCGDLTSAFDFANPNRDWAALGLPDTSDFMNRVERSTIGTSNAIPAVQQPTTQMPGQRPARPLPYDFTVTGTVTPQHRFRLAMRNPGPVGVVLSVHDNTGRQKPWSYTIGAGDQHDSEQWHDAGPIDAYDFSVHGPNGFFRCYTGSLASDAPAAEAILDRQVDDDAVRILLINNGTVPLDYVVTLADPYRQVQARRKTLRVPPGQQIASLWPLKGVGWYDINVTMPNNKRFARRFAGSTNAARATDPAIGAMRI
jgi:phospholipase C